MPTWIVSILEGSALLVLGGIAVSVIGVILMYGTEGIEVYELYGSK
jgi:hypothetical protein